MAYGSAEIGTPELALFNADKPVVCGLHKLRDASDVRWTTGGLAASSDLTHADGPTSYLADDFDHLQSYPNTTATTWYINFDFGASNLAVVDTCILKNHNLFTISATSVELQFDTNQNGSFSATQDCTISSGPTDNKRIVVFDLHHTGTNPRRYSDVRYARLKIVTSGASTPYVGEIFLGRRRQLKHNPQVGMDPRRLLSHTARFVSEAGVATSYSLNRNRQILEATLRMSEDAYIDDWVTFFTEDTYGGSQPFWWSWEPSAAAPEAVWFYFEETVLSGPSEGYTERVFEFVAAEQGPNFLANGAGV